MTTIRLATLQDAAAITELVTRNRSFLAPWTPLRTDEYFTLAGQERLLDQELAGYGAGRQAPYVITAGGEIVGRITLSGITRGAFQSASVSYWVSRERTGQGIATSAVAALKEVAFADLGLHRLQGETLVDNVASQRVLEANGFVRYGRAEAYLRIAGEWRDHVLYQALSPHEPSGGAARPGGGGAGSRPRV